MGEAAHNIPESTETAPLGAVVNLETEPEAWPKLEFKWDERAIFGFWTSSTNKETRLLSVVGSILEAAPELRRVLGDQNALETRRRIDNATTNKVRTGSNQSMHPYSFDHPEVFEQIWSEKMGPANHPAVQAWHAVRSINSSHRGRAPILTDAELASLTIDLIFVFAGDNLIEAYSQSSEAQEQS